MDPSKIREKIGRFRILVIGRANAGKTTILQRVCNIRENPEIYNSAGKKIDTTVLRASRERGEHNIDNEMIFRSNPGFIFHDSCGFEAGCESEFEKVKAFIANRSKETRLRNQLHAIWYCIPMDEASRSFTQAEIKFFSQCDTGIVPVIVLFTKFDALYGVEFRHLRDKGTSRREAAEQAPKRAEELFATGPQLKFLKDVPHPPKCHVCLPHMDKDDADCGPLIERTTETLDDKMVKQLLFSIQQANLERCMKYAVERTLPRLFDLGNTTVSEGHWLILEKLGAWFPHIAVLDDDDDDYLDYLDDIDFSDSDLDQTDVSFFILCLQAMLTEDVTYWQILGRSRCEEMWSRLLSVAFGSSPFENIVQLSSAAVIIFEHSFYILDESRYLEDQQKSGPSFYIALERYMKSPHANAVREAVSAAVQAYEAAVTTATHGYEEAVRTLLASRAESSFKRFRKMAKEALEHSKENGKEALKHSKEKEKESLCSQAKVEFMKTVLEITLNHRLPQCWAMEPNINDVLVQREAEASRQVA